MVWSDENLCPIGVVTWLGFTAAPADPRHGLRQAMAAVHASDGCGPDRSRLDAARGAALPRATVAAASRGMSLRWWEAARGGGLSGRGAFTRLALRVSPGMRGLLGGHESPLIWTF